MIILLTVVCGVQSTCSFNERIDLFVIVYVIANLNRMALMIKMNVGPLAHVISMDVEDHGVAHYHTLRRLLANLGDKCGFNGKKLLSETIKFCIILSEHKMIKVPALA